MIRRVNLDSYLLTSDHANNTTARDARVVQELLPSTNCRRDSCGNAGGAERWAGRFMKGVKKKDFVKLGVARCREGSTNMSVPYEQRAGLE